MVAGYSIDFLCGEAHLRKNVHFPRAYTFHPASRVFCCGQCNAAAASGQTNKGVVLAYPASQIAYPLVAAPLGLNPYQRTWC